MRKGSKANNIEVWAKARREFCCYFWGYKGSSISMFFHSLHLFFTLSKHQRQRFCNWVHQVCQFSNLQKRKGIRLGPLFSNQISLVTLRSLFPISGQTKFLIPSPVYILPCTLYNPITYLLIKNDNIHNYIHTFEYFERKDKIGLWSWLKPSKNRTLKLGSNTYK